ncbi:MAG TPA: chemotaxis protein CheB [Desulfuromonadales bacterium]|nr:chemotaxis protein CheB [Desulfuromonadales bacterium]
MLSNNTHTFEAVVIGVSTGGVSALKIILGELSAEFPLPVMIVSHISPDSDDGLALLLNNHSALRVKEADEQEELAAGTAYLSPANYHLMIEQNRTLSLSVDPPVNYARPSVDVLFETAADVFGPTLIGIVLTGAGSDGSQGLLKIKNCGGLTIVQDPADAEMDSMPLSALQLLKADYVEPLNKIASLLTILAG